jgi:hypothetical protein
VAKREENVAPTAEAAPERPRASAANKSDAPVLDPSSAIVLVPSPLTPGSPTSLQQDNEPPSVHAQAARIVREVAAEHRRATQPPNEYFTELRAALEGLWRVEALERRKAMPEGDKARVRLVQREDGALLEVALITPPQSAEIGRSLLGDLQAGAASLPRPPPEVMRGRPQLASLWEFLLKPQAPAVKLTLDFDMVSLVDKRAIPKFTRKRVEFILQEE